VPDLQNGRRGHIVTTEMIVTKGKAKSPSHLASPCPIARSVDVAGQWWSTLILRDAFYGISRFDEFEKSLGIAPTMLTRRLTELVERGLLERRRYSTRPPRYEYALTERGRDFWPVLVALMDWGNRHLAPEGESVVLINRTTGRRVVPLLTEAGSGKRINSNDHILGAGPKANEHIKRRTAFGAARRSDPSLRPEFLFE
jgi:DNA-binding HxlR family transcriptional regulator